MVKYTGTWTPVGSGNGGRSTGIGVRLTSRTILPSSSVIVVRGGMCSSRPGINGFVTTTSRVVGEGMRTARAMSSTGIQIVNGSMLVRPATIVRPYSKRPNRRRPRLAVRRGRR